MVSRGCPAGRCGTSSAPVAALTIGGTTGISQPPNAPSGAARSRVIIRYGTATLLARPASVPSGQSTASMASAACGADQGRAEQQRPRPDGEQGHRRRAVELHHDRVAGMAQGRLPVPGPVDDLGRGQHEQPERRPAPRSRWRSRAARASCTGRVAAAVATMPVPITEANQFGPRLANASDGRSRSRSGPRPVAAGPVPAGPGAARPRRARAAAGGACVLMTPASRRAARPGSRSLPLSTHNQLL